MSTTTSVTTMAINPAQAQPRRTGLAARMELSGAVRASQTASSDTERWRDCATFSCAAVRCPGFSRTGRRRARVGADRSGGGRAGLPSALRTRLRESWTASNTATLAVRNELRTTEVATLVAAATAL